MRHWSHRVTEVHPSLFLLFSALFRYHIPWHRKKAAITVSISTRVYIQILSPIGPKLMKDIWSVRKVGPVRWSGLSSIVILIWDQLYFCFFSRTCSTLYKCRKRPNLADKSTIALRPLECTSDIHLSPLQTDKRITVCFYISRRKGPIVGRW